MGDSLLRRGEFQPSQTSRGRLAESEEAKSGRARLGHRLLNTPGDCDGPRGSLCTSPPHSPRHRMAKPTKAKTVTLVASMRGDASSLRQSRPTFSKDPPPGGGLRPCAFLNVSKNLKHNDKVNDEVESAVHVGLVLKFLKEEPGFFKVCCAAFVLLFAKLFEDVI